MKEYTPEEIADFTPEDIIESRPTLRDRVRIAVETEEARIQQEQDESDFNLISETYDFLRHNLLMDESEINEIAYAFRDRPPTTMGRSIVRQCEFMIEGVQFRSFWANSSHASIVVEAFKGTGQQWKAITDLASLGEFFPATKD